MTGARKLSSKQIGAVALGNAIEFYDFITYSFFAVQIGRTFFPSADPATSLLASLATFGAGFLTRPLGALVIGRLGDRVGRKPMMLFTFMLIGCAIVGLALTPSYSSIGVAAPVLVIIFRLIQGFALGGEVGPSTAFLVEAAPPGRRGLYVSFQYMGQDAAILLAGLVGFTLASLMDGAALTQWGWRIAFLLGAIIVPVGLFLRHTLEETLDVEAADRGHRPPFSSYRRIAFLGLFLIIAATIAAYILDYLTTYAISTLHMSEQLAFGSTILLGLCGVIGDPLGGWLSDRFGRKPVMMLPWMFLLATVLPAFWLVSHFPTAASLYAVTALLQLPLCISSSSVLVSVTETLPTRVRCGSLALIYALAVSVFGGSAQFIVAWLTKASGNAMAPAWYMTAAATMGLVAMFAMRESSPRLIVRQPQLA